MVVVGAGLIYLRMRITKEPIVFIEDGDIPDGANMFPVLTFSCGNYEGEMRYITILPIRWNQTDAPIKPEEQFALRSELGD